LLLGSVSAASAQQKSASAGKRSEIEKAISSFMSAKSVPGIGVAVVLEGEPVWSAGFGMADLEDSAPATSSTLFRLGSISKPITATAILQLWERGKLDLDAPVQKYCPAFPQKESPITSRGLLGHLGGIRPYSSGGKGDIPEDSARHFASMEESLQIFAADPLVAKPGTKFNFRPAAILAPIPVRKKSDGKLTATNSAVSPLLVYPRRPFWQTSAPGSQSSSVSFLVFDRLRPASFPYRC
jgi:CubicO group peptidase (beta-lactamase class C family)